MYVVGVVRVHVEILESTSAHVIVVMNAQVTSNDFFAVTHSYRPDQHTFKGFLKPLTACAFTYLGYLLVVLFAANSN